MEQGITTSVFEIFKPGPGPSSSHTIGPMRAAADFLERLCALDPAAAARAARFELGFYGSLAATGKGHGSDRAAVAGLLGEKPESCDIDLLRRVLTPECPAVTVSFAGRELAFEAGNILWCSGDHAYPFQNTMRFRLLDGDGRELLAQVYYSTGGGFIRREGEPEPERRILPYRYRNMDSFKLLSMKYNLPPVAMLRANEMATGLHASEAELDRKLDFLIDTMFAAVGRGLRAEGVLPGPIGLSRRAKRLYERANRTGLHDRFLVLLDAFALAVAEENAAGSLVVTAPTAGSAGLLPGVMYLLESECGMPRAKLRDGLFAAALIGMIARANASISGAEVGCQGEVGVASAMAAALLSFVHGGSLAEIECAAEIALEHHLGMTCDPIEGYVQIPCIERNAVGAVTAYNSYLLASMSDPALQKVSFDEVVAAMLQTGQMMPSGFKETSRGGLAVCSLCR